MIRLLREPLGWRLNALAVAVGLAVGVPLGLYIVHLT